LEVPGVTFGAREGIEKKKGEILREWPLEALEKRPLRKAFEKKKKKKGKKGQNLRPCEGVNVLSTRGGNRACLKDLYLINRGELDSMALGELGSRSRRGRPC